MTDPDDLLYGPLDDEAPVIDEVAIERALRGWRVELTRPERIEFVRRGAATGASDATLGRALGICAESVGRIRHKNGIPAARPAHIPVTRPAFGKWLKESA